MPYTLYVNGNPYISSSDDAVYGRYPLGDKFDTVQYAIGVNAPWWGYGETAPARPADWSSEVAGYYYVNNDTGTDSGRTYGTPTAPRSTIPTTLPVGTIRVEVAGTYDVGIGSAIAIKAQGTEGQPTWLVGDPSDRPVFTTYLTLFYGSWFFIEDIDITQTANNYVILQVSSATPGLPADHIMIRDCNVTGWSGGGPGVAVAASGSTEFSSNVLIQNLTIQNLNLTTNPEDVDTHGINVLDYCEDIWILGNTIYNTAGSGMQIGVDPNNRRNVKRAYVAKNSVTQSRQAGIWVKNGSDIIISENTIDGVVNASWSESKALGGQYFVEGVWWLFNTITDCRYGIRVVAQTGAAIPEFYGIGNVMYDLGQGFSVGATPWDTCAIHVEGGDTLAFIDNSIYDTASGIQFSKTSDFTSAVVSGNIIENITDAAGWHFWSETATQNGAVLDYNQFNDLTGFRAKNGATGTEYTTLASWQSATSNSVNDQYGDPLFTDPVTTRDFTLQAGSPCIDSSAEAAVYDLFFTNYGLSIKFDEAGNARPATSGDWDRGALERVV